MSALHYTGVGDSWPCLGAAIGKPVQIKEGLGNKIEENFFCWIELPIARYLWGRNRNWQLAIVHQENSCPKSNN